LIARDRLLAEQVIAQAVALDLTVLMVDNSRSLEDMLALLEEHFAPFL
jgi:hypothetical protein